MNSEKKKILVIGDIMLDHYIYGQVERISPDAPIPVVKIEREEYRLGGAANVYQNIIALGGQAYLCGLVGQDQYEEKIKIREEDDLTCYSINKPTTVKTRIIGNGQQQMIRLDREDLNEINQADFASLKTQIDLADHQQGDIGLVVVSDYGKGVITAEVMALLWTLGAPIFVDTKRKDVEIFKGIELVKPNFKEAQRISGQQKNQDETFANWAICAADKISQKMFARNVLITMGENGMFLLDREKQPYLIRPDKVLAVKDVLGAGDTVMAAMAVSIMAGNTYYAAAVIANRAAGIAVSKPGTAVVDKGELA